MTYPVEMFVHIMEFKDAQPTQTGLVPESQIDVPDQGGTDKLIQSVLNHIPDPKYSSKGSNAALGGKTDPPASLNVPGISLSTVVWPKDSLVLNVNYTQFGL